MLRNLFIPILAVLGPGILEAADSYTFTALNPANVMSEVTSLDDAGRVFGRTAISHDPYDIDTHAFVWEAGKLGIIPGAGTVQSLTDEGIVTGTAYFGAFSALWKNGAISPLGVDGGYSGRVAFALGADVYAGIYAKGSDEHAFVRTPQGSTDLTPSGDVARLVTVTPSGTLIGSYTNIAGSQRVFTWKDGVQTDLLPDGAKAMWVIPEYTDHARGQIAGFYTTESFSGGTKTYAYIWRDGALTTLVPTSHDSKVSAVGRNGEVGGYFYDSSYRSHAFLWRDNVLTDLTPSGNANGSVIGIGDSGHVLVRLELLVYQWENGALTPIAPAGSLSSDVVAFLPDGTVLYSYKGADNTVHEGLWKDGVTTLISAPWLTDVQSIGAIDRTESGRFVFEWADSANKYHAFFWKDGVATEITPPVPGVSIRVKKITPSGYVGGEFRDANGNNHPFVWFEGVSTDLSRPGEDSGRFMAINDSGLVGATSFSETAGNFGILTSRVFVWEKGAFTDLPSPPYGRLGGIDAIYESGMVVGTYTYVAPYVDEHGNVFPAPPDEAGSNEGFVWKDGAYVTVPGAISMFFGPPNALGVSLGTYGTGYHNGQDRPHALVLENNVLTELEDFLPPGITGSSAVGLNASGQIAGAYIDPQTSRPRAFLLTPGPFTPFPEPPEVNPPRDLKPALKVAKRPPAATKRRVISLQGTVVGRVSYRVNAGPWRNAVLRSPGRWQIRVPLRIGKNSISLRAISSARKSSTVKISISRFAPRR